MPGFLDDAITQLDAIIAKLEAASQADRTSPANPGISLHEGSQHKAATPIAATTLETGEKSAPPSSEPQAQKPKAKKEKKPAVKVAAPAVPDSGPGLFARAQLQVAKVLTVDEIASDKLYKTTIDIGGGQTRQVVAGLKQHVERKVLLGSLVVAILNLKPAKLAGEASEAMLLAADAPLEAGGELVKVLIPPEGSSVGDQVSLEGSSPAEEYPKVLKSGPWKDIVAGLSVRSGRATFEGQPLVTAKGYVSLPAEMPDGAGIH